MSRTVVFVHGGWVTPTCWEPFVSFFGARGYRCLAPAWPGKDRSVEEIRADPSPLAGLGMREIVDHYERIVRELDDPPILIGHSFGGLFVQVLLDRGLGAAGIAIDTAPPKGVFALHPTSLLSVGRVLLVPFGWRKVVRWTFTEFRYAFVHTMPFDEARVIWEAQIVPDSGRPFFQGAFAMFDRQSPARVDFTNPDRAPLLFIAGEADRAMPTGVVRQTFRAHRASPARTDLRTFPGRTHWIIAEDGWEEVAQACVDWIGSLRVEEEARSEIERRDGVRSSREKGGAMQTVKQGIGIKEAASTFLANKRIAITGVSRKPKEHGSNTVYKRLRDRGYEVFAVNPNATEVEGDRTYPDLRSIPGGVDAVVIGTRPSRADDTMRECAELGIKQVWMHRGPGSGSVSDTATAYGRQHGITVIDGGCPCMFGPTADFGHKVMRVFLSSHVPKQV